MIKSIPHTIERVSLLGSSYTPKKRTSVSVCIPSIDSQGTMADGNQNKNAKIMHICLTNLVSAVSFTLNLAASGYKSDVVILVASGDVVL